MISEPEFATLPAQAPFYLSRDNRIYGPHPLGEIPGWLEESKVVPEDLIWMPGWEDWQSVGYVFSLPGSKSAEIPASILAGEKPFLGSAEEVHLFRRSSDGLSFRLTKGAMAALAVHVVLLLLAMWLVTLRYHKKEPVLHAAPLEAPPLEVALVTEDETVPTPPAPPPPVPVTPTPPPPDLLPPPPPAPPVVPIETPPPPPVPELAAPALPQTPTEPVQKPVSTIQHKTVTVHASPRAQPVALPAPVANNARDAVASDYLNTPDPTYPPEALRRRQIGTVLLRVTVDENGAPTDVQIERSSGFPILDRNAQTYERDNQRFRVGTSRVLLVPVVYQINR